MNVGGRGCRCAECAVCVLLAVKHGGIVRSALREWWELHRRRAVHRELLERCARQAGGTERVGAVRSVGLRTLRGSEVVRGQARRAGRGDGGVL